MKKIVLACALGIFVAFGAGSISESNAVSVESEEILPNKAEYKISQIVVGGKSLNAVSSAIFGVDGTQIYGNTGCNNYFTDFVRVDSETIEISTNGGSTKMMCDKKANNFEHIFLQHLVGTFSIVENEGGITLTNDKMQVVLQK